MHRSPGKHSNSLGRPEQAQAKVVFDAPDCVTVMFPKIYYSNVEPPCALPNVVHKVESQ